MISTFGSHGRRVVTLILISSLAVGQSPRLRQSDEQLNYLTSLNNIVLAVADFDGDGIVDLLRRDGVLFNGGSGEFANVGNAPGGIFACGVNAVTADMDGDGDVDVVVNSCTGGQLICALNDGVGVFSSFVPLPIATLVDAHSELQICDLDGDGRPDVAATLRSPIAPANTIVAWIQSPIGGIGFARFQLPSASTPMTLRDAGDFDGDGADELVISILVANVGPLMVPALVKFTSSGLVFVSQINAVPAIYAFAVADWTNDGIQDLLLTRASSNVPVGNLTNLLLAGTPTGLASPIVTTNSDYTLDTTPYDWDGVPPLEAIRVGHQIEVVRIGPTGTETPLVTIDAPYVFPRFAGDFDGDGDQDVLTVDGAGSYHVAYHAPGRFVFPRGSVDPSLDAHGGRWCIADLNGDGHPDLITATLSGVALNDGFGHFTVTHHTLPRGVGEAVYGAVCIADFDGDGVDDVFSGNWFNGHGHDVFLTSPGLRWRHSVAIAPPGVSQVARAGDVDQDGDMDVVCITDTTSATGISARIDLVRNAGGGAFVSNVILAGHRSIDLALVDFDLDGDMDILVANLSGTSTPDPSLWLENTGGGVFVQRALPVTVEATAITGADLDGDGDVDLVVNGNAWIRTGTNWAAAPGAAEPYNGLSGNAIPGVYTGHRLVDIDGDGVLDLVTDVAWHRGLGAAGFGLNEPWPYAGQTSSFNADGMADLDGDGDVDVVPAVPMILWNVTRQLTRGMFIRPGHTGTLEVRGAPSEPYILAASLGRAVPPIAIPGWGTITIDLATAFVLPPTPLDFTGFATIPLSCPNNPALVGATLYWQAALPQQAKLTSAVATTVLGL